MNNISERNSRNFVYLVAALTGLLLLIACSEQIAGAAVDLLIRIGITGALGTAVLSIRRDRAWFRSGIGIVTVSAILIAANALTGISELIIPNLILVFVFFAGMIWLTGDQVLRATTVDGNTLLGAIGIYLMLGLLWAIVYFTLALLDPDSFTGGGIGAGFTNFPTFVYFSFVSLTTLGFGDISPQAPIARLLVYLQAIAGQFYLAIMIAGLVGIRISERMTSQNK